MHDVARSEWRGLAVLGVFTAVSLAGFASFGRHPELLAAYPQLASLYAPAFPFFARGHVLIALAVLAFVLTRRVGLGWLPAFLVVYAVSLAAELLGTATGFPFGAYHYTGLLGPLLAERVPALIPASWFIMAFPAYGLARALVSDRRARWVVGAALLTIWDLTLDPAMSALTPYWIWDVPGAFYGMPAVNVLGWLVTGVVIMIGLDVVRAGPVADLVPTRLLFAYYGTVLALSVGMVAVAGYWLAVSLTAIALVSIFAIGRPFHEFKEARDFKAEGEFKAAREFLEEHEFMDEAGEPVDSGAPRFATEGGSR